MPENPHLEPYENKTEPDGDRFSRRYWFCGSFTDTNIHLTKMSVIFRRVDTLKKPWCHLARCVP